MSMPHGEPLGLRRPPPTATTAAPAVTQVRSDTLFGGAREVQILHDGTVYRLKQTALGKLILTK